MVVKEFLKSLAIYDKAFIEMLDRLSKKESNSIVSIDWQIILYCRRQLQLATKVVPESAEMSAHIARCFLELEIILKWLKQDVSHYEFFRSDAEYANLNLMKSKKEAIEIFAPEFTEKFMNSIATIEQALSQKGHTLNQDKLSPLYDIKGTAKKIDGRAGKLVKAKHDFFSKMSHPTAWLILMDTTSDEMSLIKKEAMSEINRAVIAILNMLDNSHN